MGSSVADRLRQLADELDGGGGGASSGGGGGTGSVMGFGKGKGKRVTAQTTEQLHWYARVLAENVADRSKARFREANQALLEEVKAALISRGETPSLDGPGSGGEGAPF